MSTTLPLFWHLSSARKQERIDASAKLVGALEHFQAQFVPTVVDGSDATSDEDEEREEKDEEDEDAVEGRSKGDGLDAYNAQDVVYSLRRLVRGLASPRESSRLGFAVALTEVRPSHCNSSPQHTTH
jgi:DNA polymerase phi